MGSQPSKDDRSGVIGNSHGEDSEMVPSSFDGDSVNGKKNVGDITTPRTNPKMNGFGGKNNLDHPIGADRRDDVTPPSHISDDQVHVNLAMADLMAYLQVVANNSNNLPLTRRDDPELGRMVSSLTSEEYARKSAAFIPADVRVIGGTFLKYGRVWDLPTSDEYNATDGAQEPGVSYGGACSNALLKVLYDAANEAADAAQTMQASDALFDDDEDEETIGSAHEFTRNTTFASIDMNDHSNPSVITWASLLRKMKAEIRDIEYAQAPKIASTRKFDLNQPFSLVPDSFDKKTGKKRSLLIGCNYTHIHGAQLKAAHDDVRSMKDYIVNVHGFPEGDDSMTILLDDEEHKHPTFLNITEAFKSLSEQSQPGDAVFIQFSGHGGRVLDSPIDSEAESYDEVIVPSDYNTSGLVRDTLMFKTLLAPMRYGVTVTVLIDCCDTGMMLELPYSWSTRSDRKDSVAKMAQNDDFSFVRFLKVVKTLYESSTFTQLGKAVGSALGTGPFSPKGDEEDETFDASRGEEETAITVSDDKGSSLLNVLGLCGSPQSSEPATTKKSSKQIANGRDVGTIDTRDTRTPSLMDQVLNCTLGQGDDASDDGTYKSEGSYDDHTLEDSTFDSLSDAYEPSKRRGRSRRRRRN